MLGARAPKTLMQADDSNARGYFESMPIMVINDDAATLSLLKDPRICCFAPFWLEFLKKELGSEPHFAAFGQPTAGQRGEMSLTALGRLRALRLAESFSVSVRSGLQDGGNGSQATPGGTAPFWAGRAVAICVGAAKLGAGRFQNGLQVHGGRRYQRR
jgi:hypothetical protein